VDCINCYDLSLRLEKEVFRSWQNNCIKRFPNEQVRSLIQKYNDKEIKLHSIRKILGIKRRRFFELLQTYLKEPEGFSLACKRDKPTRKISKKLEENILKELSIETHIIHYYWVFISVCSFQLSAYLHIQNPGHSILFSLSTGIRWDFPAGIGGQINRNT